MILRYELLNGEQQEFKMDSEAVTIGRSVEADISIPDNLASRVHCGISFSNNVYYLRDFKSKNGTYVNDRRIEEVVRLQAGDKIRIGATIIMVEPRRQKGTETVLMEIKEEMDKGKGYKTMLIEIVEAGKNG